MKKMLVVFLSLFLCSTAYADLVVPMNFVDENGIGKSAGKIVIKETAYGLVFTPNLKGLSPGRHGFHIHENPSCEPGEKNGKIVPALAAGGHYDPHAKGGHRSPWGDGHLGDLAALPVDHEGKVTAPSFAPRIRKIDEIRNRSLMIHAGGDNYSDRPMILGGGGGRIACGVIP